MSDLTGRKHGQVSRALARDRLGVPAVLFFVLAGVAPLTVAAGVIPTAYATTGLTGIPAAFVVIAVILAIFASPGTSPWRATSRTPARSTRSSPTGWAASSACPPRWSRCWPTRCCKSASTARSARPPPAEAATYLHIHAQWWVWALGAWAIITVLGLLRVDITGRVLGVLLCAEIAGHRGGDGAGAGASGGRAPQLRHPLPGRADLGRVRHVGVLAVIAVLGFVGFEQAPVLAEEARNTKRTIPVATYTALGMIAVMYAGACWAMAAHTGTRHVVAAAGKQGPGLLFGLGGSSVLGQAAQGCS